MDPCAICTAVLIFFSPVPLADEDTTRKVFTEAVTPVIGEENAVELFRDKTEEKDIDKKSEK